MGNESGTNRDNGSLAFSDGMEDYVFEWERKHAAQGFCAGESPRW